ncbi:MAG: hypothetical protein WDZ40_04410 [Candidatus Spechtbacterales bacterium]
MQPTNSTTKKKIVFLLIVSLVLVMLLFFIQLLTNQGTTDPRDEERTVPPGTIGNEEYLIENPELPKTSWQRKVEIQKEDGMQTVTNFYDGYRIDVSSDWEIVEEVRGGLGGLNLLYGQHEEDINEYETEQHIHDGLVLSVVVFENEEGFNLIDWLARSDNHGSFLFGAELREVPSDLYKIYKTERPLTEDRFIDGKIVDAQIEDTLSSKYIIKDPKIDSVYVLICTIYNNVNTLVPLCEEAMQGFNILK